MNIGRREFLVSAASFATLGRLPLFAGGKRKSGVGPLEVWGWTLGNV